MSFFLQSGQHMLSSVPKSKHKTYAEATRATNVSLLHTDITPTQQENTDITRVHQTRIYRSSRSAGVFLFDITSCKPHYYDQQCVVELKKQHPNVHACMALSEGPTRYLEVYVTPANDSNDIQRNGLNFPDAHLQVLPCKAISERAQIINLKLSHLPMFTPEEVLNGLKTSLAVFGNVLDIGISTEKAAGLFMGSGYAVLDISLNPVTPDIPYQKLSHQISWMESTTDVFHATWNNMPAWCRYCHQDGHTKFNRDSSKARVLCYSCHEQGHRSYECTRRNSTTVPNKKKERKTSSKHESTPALPATEETTPPLPPSDNQKDSDDQIVDKNSDDMLASNDGSTIDEAE
ncbi:hypothetical protein BD770DRAFT_451506 [Pilaira anomala]|nr:hypothetical protein BD770DRAFT_451506 [Pilaira anomala]